MIILAFRIWKPLNKSLPFEINHLVDGNRATISLELSIPSKIFSIWELVLDSLPLFPWDFSCIKGLSFKGQVVMKFCKSSSLRHFMLNYGYFKISI